MTRRRHTKQTSKTRNRKANKTDRLSKTRASSLSVETLESRIVLTAGVSISDGELIVYGDNTDNTIVVAELENDYLVDADFLGKPVIYSKLRVSSVRVVGGGGNDTIVATSLQSPVTLQGNDGDDRIFGGKSGDLLEGGAGNDLIYGNGGDDLILGGAGIDRVFAGDGNDVVNGGDGGDLLLGNDGDDTLNGNVGNDRIFGSRGNDTLVGGAGDDSLFGGAGADTLRGGIGNDTLVGNGDADELFGESGDDRLLAAGGDDTLDGGPGNDVLVGGLGDDALNGSSGADRLFGNEGADTIIGGNGDDIAFGGLGPDTMFGNDGDDELTGGIGADVIAGHGGNDKLFGGDYQDILIGGAGNDLILGQGGQDILIPGIANNQTDPVALDNARTFWTSAIRFEDRVENVLTGVDVFPESAQDRLIGGPGLDAFFAAARTQVVDRQALEPIVDETGVDNRFIAVEDAYDLAIGETLTTTIANGVLSNDIFPNAGNVTATVISPPAQGDITFNPDGTFTYTQSTLARDSFVYEITGENGMTARATVRITTPILPVLPDGATLTTTESGLQFYDFVVGTGASPVRSDTVTVAYSGHLPDGSVFDSNTMANFPLTGVIAGFAEGIEGMRVGGMRRIVIPPDLGYGSGGNLGAGIGGTDTITFDVTLQAIL